MKEHIYKIELTLNQNKTHTLKAAVVDITWNRTAEITKSIK